MARLYFWIELSIQFKVTFDAEQQAFEVATVMPILLTSS